MKTSPTLPNRPRAFTLIELLTVIAIIGILAAIIIPTVGRVRESANSAKCISNLRQLGMGISLYVQANKNRMPGPLYVGQGPQYTPDGKFGGGSVGNLANIVAPYLTSLSATSTGQKRQNMLECPSWLTKTKSLSAPSFVINSNPVEFKYLAPFGRLDSGAPLSQPVSFGKLSSFPLSQTWLMMDADKEQSATAAASWKDQIPERPVHGSKRNALYYDGHVSSVPITKHSITSAP